MDLTFFASEAKAPYVCIQDRRYLLLQQLIVQHDVPVCIFNFNRRRSAQLLLSLHQFSITYIHLYSTCICHDPRAKEVFSGVGYEVNMIQVDEITGFLKRHSINININGS